MKTNLTILILLLIFSGCIQKEESIQLTGVEVRNYKGEKLSSVNDFRENSIKGPQNVDVETYRLEVTGLVEKPKSYKYTDILKKQSYTKIITLYCVEGWDVTLLWQGVLVKDILADAKIKNPANTIIFYAVDGYSTSFDLDYVMDNDILLAYKMNNITLPPERGFPLQLVAEDKWGYKWIKWVNKIEITDDPSYRGFWESRGYNQKGDLSGSKYT